MDQTWGILDSFDKFMRQIMEEYFFYTLWLYTLVWVMIEWMWEYLRISKRYASPPFNLLITNTLILTHKLCMYLV